MSPTVRRRTGSGPVALTCGSPALRRRVAAARCQCAPRASRCVQRRRHAVEQPVRDLALRQQRPRLGVRAGRVDRDAVRVRAEAAPASATSFATSRSTPFARSFSPARVERTGLGREADEDRPRLERLRAIAPALSSPGRSDRPRRGCPASARARASSPSPRVELRRRRPARPEVGDGGGHDQRVEARRRPSRSRQRRQDRGAHRAGRFGADDRASVGQRRRSIWPAISVTAAPRVERRPRRSRRPSCRWSGCR